MELSQADVIQILILLVMLLSFYAAIVRAFARISDKVDRHEALLYSKKSEVTVVTHTACKRIREACPVKAAVARLETEFAKL